MGRIVDPIALDPVDFLPKGTELDLTREGLKVLDADFGEADVELAMQRAELGEMPVGWHPPDTQTVLKLGVGQEGDVDLPTAAHLLQAKYGEINTPGTEHWMRRDFIVGGNFAGSLGKQVKKASLSGLGAWQRGECPDVVLQMLTGPYWYATVEEESDIFKSEEGARELIFELAEILGTAPGLIRIWIKNEGEEHWRGLIFAAESRDHPQDDTADTTAALAYDAVDLTLKGGAEEAEREGEKVVRYEGLAASWLTILDSEKAGVGHMTHKGVRRLWMRIWDPGAAAGGVQLRLRWRSLGSLYWSDENPIIPTPLVDAWAMVDLDECRPEQAAVGDERWQWQLQVRRAGTATTSPAAIEIQRVYPLPTEQYALLKARGTSAAADTQSAKSPGTVANDAVSGLVAWSNPSNAISSNNSRATAAIGAPGKETSQVLVASDFGFEIPEDATIAAIIPEVERSSVSGKHKDLAVKVQGGIGSTKLPNLASPDLWPSEDQYQAYGASNPLWGQEWQPPQINEDLEFLFSAKGVEAGTAGVDDIRVTVGFTEAGDENRICFTTRSAEMRTNGAFRQHPEDDVWGRVITEGGGFLPFAPPSGLEGRKMRGILIPTQGDLELRADNGSNPVSAQVFHRPAYHFARGSAD